MGAERRPAAEWLEARRQAIGDRHRFVATNDVTVTHGEITEHVERFAGLVAARRITPGAAVMLITADIPAIAQLTTAVVRNGHTLCVIDPAGTAREIRYALTLVEPELVIADPDVSARCSLADPDAPWQLIEVAAAAAWRTSLKSRLLGRRAAAQPAATTTKAGPDTAVSPAAPVAAVATWPAAVNAAPRQPPPANLDPEHTAVIVFTSGSTSRAKAIRLSLRAIVTHLETLCAAFGFDNGVFHNVLPPWHVDGLFQGPLLAYFAGGTWLRPCEFSVPAIPELLDAIYRERATHMLVVPTLLAFYDRLGSDLLDAFDTDDFRMVISSAGPLGTDLWTRFEQRFSTCVCNSYGLSETVTSSIASGPAGSPTRRVGTIGKPIDCTVELLDEAGEPVADGEVGEIVITGDHIFSGYIGDDAATRAVLDGRTFRTGDLARRDPDGFFELRGRRSSMIIRGGRNVSPLEVDETIERIPGVQQSATVGIDDPVWGQRIETAIVADAGITADHVLEVCRSELSAHKLPQRVTVLDELPVKVSGKVDTAALAALLASPATGAGGDAADVDAAVLRMAAEAFRTSVDELSLSASVDEVDGWDSLAHLTLVGAVEDAYGFEMSNADILGIKTLADVAELARRDRS